MHQNIILNIKRIYTKGQNIIIKSSKTINLFIILLVIQFIFILLKHIALIHNIYIFHNSSLIVFFFVSL